MTILMVLAILAATPEAAPRGRDLGIPFDFGRPGPHNAITDVPGVVVGHSTLVEGEAIRTGVTAVLPRGNGVLLVRLLRRRPEATPHVTGEVRHELRLGGFDAPSVSWGSRHGYCNGNTRGA